jgi:hypothetical protein
MFEMPRQTLLNYWYILFQKRKSQRMGTSRRQQGIRKGWMRVNVLDVFCLYIWKENNETCWNYSKNGRKGMRENYRGDESKIYCKHTCKCHNISSCKTIIGYNLKKRSSWDINIRICIYKTRKSWGYQKVGRGIKMVFPSAFGENNAFLRPWFQPFGLKTWEVTDFCCLEPYFLELCYGSVR